VAGKKNRKQKLAARSANKKGSSQATPREASSAYIADLLKQAVAHHRQQNLTEAASAYRAILASDPTYADALHLLGLTYGQSGRHQKAIEFYNLAIEQTPHLAAAYNNKGISLNSLREYQQAIECFQQVLAINPDDAGAHSNLGHAFSKLGKHQEAINHLSMATQLNPDHPDTIYNLGNALKKANQADEALACFNKTLALNPSHANALGQLSICLRQMCEWKAFEQTKEALCNALLNKDIILSPLVSLMWFDDPQIQPLCARAATNESTANIPRLASPLPVINNTKIKIAYLSSDFCEHPVAYLTAELYELHDRSQFEISAISYGTHDSSSMRQRLINAFDHFYDASNMNDAEVAALIADKGVHIIIDLNGHTLGAWPAVLAMRPAPIQINYLGYIGSMGADFIDYVIVDEFAVPPDQQACFDEQLLHLPCYMVIDTQRKIADKAPTRAEHGLPEKGFVFCSFNNSYKITPEIFSCWMQCLDSVPNSVLWLVGDNEWAHDNLRNEAKSRGIEPTRLIFAKRTDYASHLARQQLADLFLDTIPYNAGTTAADALWMALPVLTITGKSFVARMGSGLVQAAGVPELATGSLDEYQRTAVKLALNPAMLTKVKEKLIALARRFSTAKHFAKILNKRSPQYGANGVTHSSMKKITTILNLKIEHEYY